MKVGMEGLSAYPFMIKPCALEQSPVAIVARVGEHTGLLENVRVKDVPFSRSQSRFGSAQMPSSLATSSHLADNWSTIKRITLGLFGILRSIKNPQ